MRILAVDDEPSILELLKTYLEAADAHQVVTAESGADALALIDAAEEDFECCLLDIQMPQMNGITLCEHLRALPDYGHVPVIMLTAMSQRTYIDKAFAVGATDYITKPFDFMELRGRLHAAAQIVYEHNQARANAETAQRLILDLGTEPKYDPDEPFSIEGVERVVSYAAFENYLFTLSRGKLLFASAFATRIIDFAELHQAQSSRELRATLKTVAQVIAANAHEPGNLVSYHGNGCFLCVCQRKTALSPDERSAEMNHALSNGKTAMPGRAAVHLVVGREIPLVSLTRAGALMAVHKALEVIEAPPPPVIEAATLSKRVLRNQSRSPEQNNVDRRGYEIVLEDIFREEGRQAKRIS